MLKRRAFQRPSWQLMSTLPVTMFRRSDSLSILDVCAALSNVQFQVTPVNWWPLSTFPGQPFRRRASAETAATATELDKPATGKVEACALAATGTETTGSDGRATGGLAETAAEARESLSRATSVTVANSRETKAASRTSALKRAALASIWVFTTSKTRSLGIRSSNPPKYSCRSFSADLRSASGSFPICWTLSRSARARTR